MTKCCFTVQQFLCFIFIAGTYKPRVKCFDVKNLAMKFERCFDSEAVTFQILSDDYSKLVFMQCDRYIEFHSAPGRYYRLRIPKYGRDLQYHYPTCDLFMVGVSPDIYRLNLERGQFFLPFTSEASEINKCVISPEHHILICGTKEGKVEAWDPRMRNKAGSLDCALDCISDSTLEGFPSVTALNFQNALTMGVGTATGQILLYDIRSRRPFFVKDHMYGLPIKNIEFDNNQNLVISMDSSIVKIWERDSGKIFTSIEHKSDFNDLCHVKNTGMLFIANEDVKILTYYIPSLGPAPKWCGFLDSLTEELEESKITTIYDDYKFITRKELDDLGMSHLLGTSLLRAYMHGYFIDIRLYKKAKSIADPFAFEKYRKKKIREKIEEERVSRVKVNKLPNVNKDLALKFMNDKSKSEILSDDRFRSLFNNPDFQIDKNSEEFRLLNPVLSKFDKALVKKKQEELKQQFEEVHDEESEGANSCEESSSDDDPETREEMRRQYKLVKEEKKRKEREERKADLKMYELKEGEDFRGIKHLKSRINDTSLAERVAQEESHQIIMKSRGSREMKFSTRKNPKGRYLEQAKKHYEERKSLHRSANHLLGKEKPRFWKGKRVA